jgi:hypothetical protein
MSDALLPMKIRPVTVASVFTVLALLLSGCASTLHLASAKTALPFSDAGTPVFVTNPELKREYAVLKKSGIYRLSETPEGARRLTLRPIVQYGRCGNPLMLSILTFGIIPGFLPAAMQFGYDLETGGTFQQIVHRLPLYERYSIWDRLAVGIGDEVIGEALKYSTPEKA